MSLRSYVLKLPSSLAARRLFAATLWSGLGEFSARALLLFSMVLVARILGAEEYGQFGIVRATMNAFAILGGMALGLTANRYIAEHKSKNKALAGEIIGSSYMLAALSGSLAGAVVFFGAGYLAENVLLAPQLRGPLQVTSVLVLLSALNGAQIGILQGLEAYRRLAIAGLFQGLIGVLCFAFGAYYFGVPGSIGGFIAYAGAGTVLMGWLVVNEAARNGIRAAWRGLNEVLPIFWKFSVPAALAGVAVAPLKWLAETTLVRISGFPELGVFHAAMTIATIVLVAASVLNAPLISLTAAARSKPSASKMSYVNLYGSWYFYLLVSVPLLMFPQLAAVPFGAEFRTATFSDVTVLLLLYSGLLLYYQGVLRLVVLSGSMWLAFGTNLLEGLTLIAAFYVAQDYGARGLAIAYVASYVIRIAVSVPLFVRRGVIPKELAFDKYFMGTMLAVVGVIVVRHLWR
jgi:O-antigen/teichoic acid export membrane protein